MLIQEEVQVGIVVSSQLRSKSILHELLIYMRSFRSEKYDADMWPKSHVHVKNDRKDRVSRSVCRVYGSSKYF